VTRKPGDLKLTRTKATAFPLEAGGPRLHRGTRATAFAVGGVTVRGQRLRISAESGQSRWKGNRVCNGGRGDRVCSGSGDRVYIGKIGPTQARGRGDPPRSERYQVVSGQGA
jgi:hypothetical protein